MITQPHISASKINHRVNLKGKMPKGYRKALAVMFNIKIVTVDKVLGGEVSDLHGVINAAYEMCITHNNNQSTSLSQLDKLIKEVKLI
jgi:hypothetical protein